MKFIENQGQVDPRAHYYLAGSETTVWFTDSGLRIALSDEQADRWNLALDFVGARAVPEGLGRTETEVSYFTGDPSHWKTEAPTYTNVAYRDLWPGIDLVYSDAEDRIKYSFLVEPGADPNDIRLAWRGSRGLRLNRLGQLEVLTGVGSLVDEAPLTYQVIGGRRVEVSSRYSLAGDSFGFDVGSYHPDRPVVIDPAMLVYAGFVGGGGIDRGLGIAVDGSGAAYVTGYTDSTEASFPESVGPDLTYNGGTYDAFVAKVHPSGTSLSYAGFIGGSGQDAGHSIAVDTTGAAYVTGYTTSTQETFPATGGPDGTFNGGVFDAFVAKVDPSGTSLSYAGYIGGSGDDVGESVAVDASGTAYVGGYTSSTQATFPDVVGPDLTYNGGLQDAFVAKVNASGLSLSYAGYIGGNHYDAGISIAVDSSGAAYVSGETGSTETTFPVAVGPDLSFNGGTWDAFVAKVAASGASLAYAGYIGGSDDEAGSGVAVDSSGAAYVAGGTGSDQATFPTTQGPDLSYNGGGDAFVAKVNPSGLSLVYSGYIGGSAPDLANEVRIDSTGAAYITGRTESTEASFPATGGPDLTFNGISDAYLAKVSPSGASLLFAGYVGGSDDDNGIGLAVNAAGTSHVTGATYSKEATFPEVGGPDLTHNGVIDAFVAKVAPAHRLTVSVDGFGAGSITSDPPGIQCGTDCAEDYVDGGSVSLTATPGENSTFDGWSGGGCSGTSPCVLTMDTDKHVTATFGSTGGGTPSPSPTPTTSTPQPPPPDPQLKLLALVAKPRKVEQGRMTKLTATVSPCPGHEGDLIQFLRGTRTITTRTSDEACMATLRVRIRRTATFRAFSPQQDEDHLAATSPGVRVRAI